jgi:hypothetical protein
VARTAAVYVSPLPDRDDALPVPPRGCIECERAARQYPRHPLLALLQDAARIAEWDSLSAPKSSAPSKDTAPAKLPATTRPDWVDARHLHYDHGRHLRDRLDAMRARQPRECAVIEWFVPRARVLTDTACGPKAAPAIRDLHRIVAQAFTDPRVWTRWHPAPPVLSTFQSQREYDAARAEHDRRVRDGKLAVSARGKALVDGVIAAWFGAER